MICPFCSNVKTSVVATIKGLENRRFRRCNKCNKTFETSEKVLIKPLDFDYLNNEYKEFVEEEKDKNDI
ncbi:TPA: hypothetical protein RPW15_001864 [Campylobacter fetus subsp. venerealis]|uniref:Transcriptional regulator, NrdR family n=1 Tax=Campylobacter fetus subsp. venerealis NCTC 10354 TaxID=983328 RepID=A0AAE6IY35_CAMFE|nr:hypothetical protein [Campylobacter fetus]OCS25327.1 transcriptional regulator [Campylobacter fetus subsp. venerealis cfvB10]OCS29076.1 transcriptional regulator [Campylobacter fetus subsp. venerealis LMG 6570 = CCUG 33900]AIR80154.1 transcriptional regulator [Campylobacter fetus subsp. venerealis 97/608]EAK0836197.1 hypothetical protein [Campylobacter fetus]EGU23634.1 Transcriptional repressor NrdR [Campylobacter fetus subsp. venerealis NCTC 10354]